MIIDWVVNSVADPGAFFTGYGSNDFGNHGSGSSTEKRAHSKTFFFFNM